MLPTHRKLLRRSVKQLLSSVSIFFERGITCHFDAREQFNVTLIHVAAITRSEALFLVVSVKLRPLRFELIARCHFRLHT